MKKDIFEFLKPSILTVILSIVFVVAGFAFFWMVILPSSGMIPQGNLTDEGNSLVKCLMLSFVVGMSIISYNLLSLIIYFVRGGHKK